MSWLTAFIVWLCGYEAVELCSGVTIHLLWEGLWESVVSLTVAMFPVLDSLSAEHV